MIDLTQIDRFGNYVELTPVSTPAICNRTPNSWVVNAGTIYLNRADGAQPTQTTTRIFRANVDNMRVTNPVNIFLGLADNNSLWDFQGGQVGCVRYNPTTKPAANKALVVKRANFRYGGGSTNTTGNGLAVDSIHGIAAFFQCQADANWSDGFNFKNALTPTTRGYMLTVNCGADDNGRGASQSNNGWTSHNDVTGLDVCGIYEGNRGGTYRSIDTSISWLVSPVVKDDFGIFGPVAQFSRRCSAWTTRHAITSRILSWISKGQASASTWRQVPISRPIMQYRHASRILQAGQSTHFNQGESECPNFKHGLHGAMANGASKLCENEAEVPKGGWIIRKLPKSSPRRPQRLPRKLKPSLPVKKPRLTLTRPGSFLIQPCTLHRAPLRARGSGA